MIVFVIIVFLVSSLDDRFREALVFPLGRGFLHLHFLYTVLWTFISKTCLLERLSLLPFLLPKAKPPCLHINPSPTNNTTPVHNPGTLPYQTWNYLPIANITVIFEDTFASFITSKTFYALKSLETTYNLPKDRFAIMLHSIPDVPDELVVWTVKQMKQMVGWGFASNVGVKGEYWHSFSSVFDRFVSLWAWG